MKRLTLYIILITVTAGCVKLTDTKTIKLGHGLDINHPVHKAMEFMAERVSEKSKGKLSIDIYPSQQLGTERQLVELLQIGGLGITKVSSGTMENFSPNMKIFGIPFIFRDRQHAYEVMDGKIGQDLLLDGEKYWLRGLTFYDAGSRSFYTKERPVYTPSDLEGLKIRVMESVTAMQMVSALGGSPTPIAWGELYTALQQGVVDGAENNPPSFYYSNHYEICKFYTLDEHTAPPDVLIISTHVWDKLTEEEQGWLQEAVDESAVFQRKLWIESENEALEAVQKAGVEIIRPDKSLFSDKVTDIYESYRDDKEIYRLIQLIKNSDE